MSARELTAARAGPARGSRRLLGAVGACALAAGCYTHRAVPLEQVPVGAPVRVRITPAEAARVGAILGREERVLEGQLLSKNSGSGVIVAVGTTVGTDATGVGPLHQRLTIPREGLVELELRQLDKLRTAGAVAGAGAVAAAVIVAAFAAVTRATGSEKEGGPDRMIPLPVGGIRLRLTP